MPGLASWAPACSSPFVTHLSRQMPRFLPEPSYRHGQLQRIGVVLLNLGTPTAPTAVALRQYLKQFLWDPRVVEIPRPLWWLILNGIILNTRPAKSAKKYAAIWTPEGSPLQVHTERQAHLLAERLTALGRPDIQVSWAMRYGQLAIGARLQEMRAAGCQRILVVPLYPQYAASTTGSCWDEVARSILSGRNQAELRLVRNFHDHPGYIHALAKSVQDHWRLAGKPEKLLMSFHGLPKFSLEKGDPYYCECQKTGRLLAEALGLTKEEYLISFQSRFGAAAWLQPYTQPTLENLAKAGINRVDVICPGFVSDCLETLEEIAMECRNAFIAQGGKTFHYLPCLNERADWIDTLADLVQTHIAGWPHADGVEDEGQRRRALVLGAKD